MFSISPDALYYSWNKMSGTSEQLVFYNKTGHELRTVSVGFEGNKIYQDNEYNQLGRLERTSLPYFPSDPIYYTNFEYDALGRVSKATYADETTSSTSYLGNTIETTNHLQQTTKQTYNAAGWLVESEDAMGGKVNYDYFSDGKLKSSNIVGQSQTTVSLKYNSRRQRRELKDPNYGTATYEYNPFNELVEQVSPKNEISIYTYDILGRMLTKTEPEGITEWIYDETTPRRIGTLQSVQFDLHQTAYVYNDLLRLTSATESINGEDYQTSYTYDEFGRVNTTTHPTGYAIKNIYNQHGYHTQIRSAQNNALLWQTDEVNAMGQITDFQTGNALLTSRIFEPETQRLTDVTTGISGQNPVQNYVYQWDEIGNLKERKTNIHNLVEFFTYDDLNRLETIKLNGTILGDHHYDPEGLGNLIYKKADGQELFNNAAYGENNDGPHALTSATTNTGVFPLDHQIIAYNSFDKAVSISEGSKQLQITYGHHRQRITQQYTDGSNTIDKVWAGACEYITENGQQKTLTYLSGPEGVFALHVKNPNGTENIRYIHKDHLGSWNTITDENGNLLQELSFDAWGNRRNPATWRSFTGTPPAPLFDRGYTGHEHLYGFQLINMNGRIYDPLVSRMLSPDNFIQAPDFSQSFNRYSYCVNNPLKHTDPSGELFWIIPQIGYSKEGGLSVGISAVVGIPASVLSIQSGANYSFKSNDLSVYRGVSALGNTVYWGFSTASGYYIGYAFGLTPYSGVPVSTNFLSIGVHYNISHNSWSGNVSAMQVDQNGWTFNPSVSAMVFPEQTTNLTRGQGFRSNDAVLSRFVTAENHKGALDYFGFEGKYNPDLKSKRYQSEDYWGATNITTGEISYGNLAFEDYSTLYGTYIKESYHARKIQSGLSIEKLPSDLQGLGMDTYLEEIHGYVHAYKRQGLFSGHNMPFSGVKFYQSQLGMFGVPYPTYPSRFSWIYKVPRRW